MIYLPAVGANIYHVLIKRQMIKLSNDITVVKMGKRILLKISREFEKMIIFLTFFGQRYLT